MISFLKSSIQITILPLENFKKYFILKRKYFSALFNIVRASYSYTKSKTLIFICRKKQGAKSTSSLDDRYKLQE